MTKRRESGYFARGGKYRQSAKPLLPYKGPSKKQDEQANLFSTCMFSWVTSLVWRLHKKKPTMDDLRKTANIDKCETNYRRFKKLWKIELEQKGEAASVKRTAFRFVKTRLIMSTFCAAIMTLFQFASNGVLVRWLMIYVSSNEIIAKWEYGIMLVLLMAFCQISRALFFALMFALNYRMGIRLRSGLLLSVFKKVMRTPPSKYVTTGDIVNMCSNDGDRLFEMCNTGIIVLTGPVMFIAGTIYCGKLLGWIGVAGCFIYIVVFPMQGLIAKKINQIRENCIKITDKRVKNITEIITSIKFIKMFSWERSFRKVILDTRAEEQSCLFQAAVLQTTLFSIALILPMMVTIFIILTAISFDVDITPSDGFTLMTLLNVMALAIKFSPVSIRAIAEGVGSMERFQVIFAENNFEEYVTSLSESSKNAIEITNASFNWPGSDKLPQHSVTESNVAIKEEYKYLIEQNGAQVTNQTEHKFCIENLNFNATKGSIVGICGSVGSGKSSLFFAILSQLHLASGEVKVQGSTAYCSQSAWIMNATIRQNIHFGDEYEVEKYKEIVKACCLLPDFATFRSADLTEVGERGINLSGGQKQRISLARAVYKDSDVYLLDDPLSALDSHVGKSIFENVVMKLLKGKTVLLITHQLQYLPSCDLCIFMGGGRIQEVGTHEGLMETKGQYYNLFTNSQTSRNCNNEEDDFTEDAHMVKDDNLIKKEAVKLDATDDHKLEEGRIIEKESVEQGIKPSQIYWRYIRAAGGMPIFASLVISSLFFAASYQFSAAWLAYWFQHGVVIPSVENNSTNTFNSTDFFNLTTYPLVLYTNLPLAKASILDHPDLDFYMKFFGLSIIGMILTGLIRMLLMTYASIHSSTKLHNDLFNKVLSGTMEFFDTTPTGRILNRFQKDQDMLDTQIPFFHDLMLMLTALILLCIVFVAYVFPWILLLLLIIMPMLCLIVYVLISAVRDTKRLDNLSRSPWLSQIVTSISGVSTIRSYNRSDDFINKFSDLLHSNSIPYYLYICILRWIITRMDFITISIVVFVSALMVALKGTVPVALAGLALSSALLMSEYFQFTIKNLFEFDSMLIAVDRVVEYIDKIPSEEDKPTDKRANVSEKWPEDGRIEFKNVQMRYRKNLPLALKGVSFTLSPSESVGVVGRTGSGKSSLAVCLFRLVNIYDGEVLIDGVDTSKVELERLRKGLSIIPQDPTLFLGSTKYNLDPFNEYSDEEIWAALEKVHLRSVIEQLPDKFNSIIMEGGTSLSMGEKQLLCLARAILRQSRIVILDEATASIDSETDNLLQQTIRSHFSSSSLLIIAHRLHTVMECDKVLVMDAGVAAEFGAPEELLKNKESLFSKLIQSSKQ